MKVLTFIWLRKRTKKWNTTKTCKKFKKKTVHGTKHKKRILNDVKIVNWKGENEN